MVAPGFDTFSRVPSSDSHRMKKAITAAWRFEMYWAPKFQSVWCGSRIGGEECFCDDWELSITRDRCDHLGSG